MTQVSEKREVNVVIQSNSGDKEKLGSLKSDKRFKNLIPFSSDQIEAFEQTAVEKGVIYLPVIYWKEQNLVIDGYPSFEIAKKHPELRFTLVDAPFADWKEAEEMVVDINLSRPTLNLYQKLELAFTHISYFDLKAKAHQNQVCTGPVQSKDKVDTLQIIADRIGCGRTTVANFQKIFKSSNVKMQKACREGKISIYTAHQQMFPPKNESNDGSKTGIKEKDMTLEMVMEGCNIFEECEKGIDVGNKNLKKDNGTPLNPRPIAEKMQSAKIVPGGIWIALNKDKSAIQVFKKSVDKEKRIVRVKVNCFKSHIVSAEDGIAIFEADHINGSTPEILSKDESDFEEAVKK